MATITDTIADITTCMEKVKAMQNMMGDVHSMLSDAKKTVVAINAAGASNAAAEINTLVDSLVGDGASSGAAFEACEDAIAYAQSNLTTADFNPTDAS